MKGIPCVMGCPPGGWLKFSVQNNIDPALTATCPQCKDCGRQIVRRELIQHLVRDINVQKPLVEINSLSMVLTFHNGAEIRFGIAEELLYNAELGVKDIAFGQAQSFLETFDGAEWQWMKPWVLANAIALYRMDSKTLIPVHAVKTAEAAIPFVTMPKTEGMTNPLLFSDVVNKYMSEIYSKQIDFQMQDDPFAPWPTTKGMTAHPSNQGYTPEPDGGQIVGNLSGVVPGLSSMAHCPACVDKWRKAVADGAVVAPPEPESIDRAIVELNDKHKWSREQIADWLDTLDIDLAFKKPGETAENDSPVTAAAAFDGKIMGIKEKLAELTHEVELAEWEKELLQGMPQQTADLWKFQDSKGNVLASEKTLGSPINDAEGSPIGWNNPGADPLKDIQDAMEKINKQNKLKGGE